MISFDYKTYLNDVRRVHCANDVVALIGKYGVVSFPREEVIRMAHQIEQHASPLVQPVTEQAK